MKLILEGQKIKMADYILYGNSCSIQQKDMVKAIQKDYPFFNKEQMSLACNPIRNALQLIPAAEDLLVKQFGPGPGLSISPKLEGRKNRSHGNKNKPNRLCVRLDDGLRSRVQAVFDKMCFVSMQDLIEAALSDFVQKYEGAR